MTFICVQCTYFLRQINTVQRPSSMYSSRVGTNCLLATHLGSLLKIAAAGELALMFFTGFSFTCVHEDYYECDKNCFQNIEAGGFFYDIYNHLKFHITVTFKLHVCSYT